ncbi:MAG TPA: hypothetical protein PKO09_11950 [Anaerolineae bacterium]|nr:hypothetical protein [Anaerolineae bacterium]
MARLPEHDIKRRQRRRLKVRAFKRRLATSTNSQERQRLIAKIRRIAPTAPVPEK